MASGTATAATGGDAEAELLLESAISSGDEDRMMALIMEHQALQVDRVLEWAARRGRVPMLQIICESSTIKERVNLYARMEGEGKDAAAEAVLARNIQALGLVLKLGFDINASYPRLGGRRLLHMAVAAANDDVDLVCALLFRGADASFPDADGWLPHHHAVLKGATRVLRALLPKNSTLVDAADHKGTTALMLAATRAGGEQLVKVLVEELGADPTLVDADGRSALDHANAKQHRKIVGFLESLACQMVAAVKRPGDESSRARLLRLVTEGKLAEVKRLLAAAGGHKLNAVVEGAGEAAVHAAARGWDPEMLRVVCKVEGASTPPSNLPDARGGSPLHHASAAVGRIALVRMLVEEFDADPWMQDADGKTPLDRAIAAGHKDAAAYLSDGLPLLCYTRRAAQAPASEAALVLVQRLLREGKVDALVAAVRDGTVAARLLATGDAANAEAEAVDMTTPLHCAVEARCPEACERLVAEAGLAVDAPNGRGQTPLLLAARQEESADGLVRALVGLGADPLRKNKRGRDTLSLCAEKGLVGSLLHLALLKRGGLGLDRAYQERDNATLLHLLVAGRDAAGVQALVESGRLPAEVYRARRLDGRMAHHLACHQGDWATLQLLIEKGGAPVKARDGSGQAALHMAASRGATAVVEWLVEHGADVVATNSSGLTARDLAQAHHSDIAAWLGHRMRELGWEDEAGNDVAAGADGDGDEEEDEEDDDDEDGLGMKGVQPRHVHRMKRWTARSKREAQQRLREERKAQRTDEQDEEERRRLEEKEEKARERQAEADRRRQAQEEAEARKLQKELERAGEQATVLAAKKEAEDEVAARERQAESERRRKAQEAIAAARRKLEQEERQRAEAIAAARAEKERAEAAAAAAAAAAAKKQAEQKEAAAQKKREAAARIKAQKEREEKEREEKERKQAEEAAARAQAELKRREEEEKRRAEARRVKEAAETAEAQARKQAQIEEEKKQRAAAAAAAEAEAAARKRRESEEARRALEALERQVDEWAEEEQQQKGPGVGAGGAEHKALAAGLPAPLPTLGRPAPWGQVAPPGLSWAGSKDRTGPAPASAGQQEIQTGASPVLNGTTTAAAAAAPQPSAGSLSRDAAASRRSHSTPGADAKAVPTSSSTSTSGTSSSTTSTSTSGGTLAALEKKARQVDAEVEQAEQTANKMAESLRKLDTELLELQQRQRQLESSRRVVLNLANRQSAKMGELRVQRQQAWAAVEEERAAVARAQAERLLEERAWAEAKAEAASVCLCPLSNELFRDPVVATDGQVYERQAIMEAFRKANGSVLSPVTLEPITDTTLVPVEPIRQMVMGLVKVKLDQLKRETA